jgi:hypothetical protein
LNKTKRRSGLYSRQDNNFNSLPSRFDFTPYPANSKSLTSDSGSTKVRVAAMLQLGRTPSYSVEIVSAGEGKLIATHIKTGLLVLAKAGLLAVISTALSAGVMR